MERIWQSHDGTPLLYLRSESELIDIFTKDENLPEITTAGSVVDVPGTGLRMYVGPDELKAGSYSTVVGTLANDHATMASLQSHIISAAIATRFVYRDGLRLAITRFSRISKMHYGAALRAGEVSVTFEASSPYWFSDERSQSIPAGTASSVTVGGIAKASLKIVITAGGNNVVDPSITTDAGVTTWIGTIFSGSTLVIDGNSGVWRVELNGVDVHTALRGKQPFLKPGMRTVTNNIPSDATVTVAWQEGTL